MEQNINQVAQAMIKNSWENFAKLYDQYIQMNMLQGFTTLAVHTKAHSRKRILEVACGSGMHTLYFAKTMLQRGAVVVSTDISEEMIKMSKNRFEDPQNDYLAIHGNKAKISPSELAPLGTKEWNLEKILKEDLDFTENDRAVIAGIANNESLPFTDGTFDCYISSLSLMIVDNHMNQLREAFRVTKSGAAFGFTVWGRRENNQNFECLEAVFEKLNLKSKDPPKKTMYDLGRDPLALKAQMEEVGFTKIRMWNQHNNFYFKDENEYLESMLCSTPVVAAMKNASSPEHIEQFKTEVKLEYLKRMGPGVLDPNNFEILVITAEKP